MNSMVLMAIQLYSSVILRSGARRKHLFLIPTFLVPAHSSYYFLEEANLRSEFQLLMGMCYYWEPYFIPNDLLMCLLPFCPSWVVGCILATMLS